MDQMTDAELMQRALELARQGMLGGKGGPFGCVVARKGVIIGEGCNEVTSTNDPTAHAEIVAIRNACGAINDFQLQGCRIYTTCEPCPMCLGAIYWSRPEKLFFAGTRQDAADAGFDDEMIYEEVALPPADRRLETVNLMREGSLALFTEWIDLPEKITY